MADELESPINILSVAFSPEWVEVTFEDADRQTRRVRELTTISIDPRLVADAVEEVRLAIRDLLTMGQVEQRDPPASFVGKR